MSDQYVASFRSDRTTYVAIGETLDYLPVYSIDRTLDGRVLTPTKMRFPGCMRFFPYADYLNLPRRRSIDYMVKTFRLAEPADIPPPPTPDRDEE